MPLGITSTGISVSEPTVFRYSGLLLSPLVRSLALLYVVATALPAVSVVEWYSNCQFHLNASTWTTTSGFFDTLLT